MKKLPLYLLTLTLFLLSCTKLSSQVHLKVNGLYAMVGVINPAVEIPLSRRSSFQSEVVYSPWMSVTVKDISGPMTFAIFMNEYRRYFKEVNDGWYVAANAGVMAFDMTKPTLDRSGVRLKDISSKGYGMMFGIAGGYELRLNDKWMLDFFFGWSFMSSFYNGYALKDGVIEGGRVYNKGEIIMTPHRTNYHGPDDPWNGSTEWLPNKIGVSIGMVIFDPQKKKEKRLRDR